jgi:hypothetical protein
VQSVDSGGAKCGPDDHTYCERERLVHCFPSD